jgi:glycerophosphoryl diester phosphodiesterase
VTLLIGHGGASAVATANTLRSFDAARDAGADMIEFDVRSARGQLVLSHLRPHFRRSCLTLDDALSHLAEPAFSAIAFNVDVKVPGYERETLDALHSHGLADRALISSQWGRVVERVRELDTGVATAISVGGQLSRRSQRWAPRTWRRAVLAALAADRFGDLMLQHKVINAEFAAAVAATGRRLFAWTVDDPVRFAELARLGVAGVTTGDPGALRAAR